MISPPDLMRRLDRKLDIRRGLSREAWAIHTQSPEGHGFVGVGYWGWDIPTQCDGNRTALFRTRKAAREALRKTKSAFPHARVYRVQVTITGIPA